MGQGDGHVTYRDAIAIVQVIAFSASLLFAVYFRRTRRIGWFTIGMFSLLRLIGAGCLLATINAKHTSGLWAAVFVCESLGLILLIFTVLEMLERINKSTPLVQRSIFLLPQVLTYIDIAISIGGFVTVSKKSNDQLLPTSWSRASTAILAIIYLYTAGLSLYFLYHHLTTKPTTTRKHHNAFPQEERKLMWCVAIVVPLLFVRVLYVVIFVITGNLFWNALKGNATVYLVMTFLMEVGFVGVCTGTIYLFGSPVVKEEKGGKEGEQGKGFAHEEEGRSLTGGAGDRGTALRSEA